MGLLNIFKEGLLNDPGDRFEAKLSEKNGLPIMTLHKEKEDTTITSVFYNDREVQTISRPRKD